MAMPVPSTRGAWQRNVVPGYIRLEPGSSNDLLPSGHIFRLSIVHICDAALRSNSPLLVLGEDAAVLASVLDVKQGPISGSVSRLRDSWCPLVALRSQGIRRK
jgi:hypothetical protein